MSLPTWTQEAARKALDFLNAIGKGFLFPVVICFPFESLSRSDLRGSAQMIALSVGTVLFVGTIFGHSFANSESFVINIIILYMFGLAIIFGASFPFAVFNAIKEVFPSAAEAMKIFLVLAFLIGLLAIFIFGDGGGCTVAQARAEVC